MLPGGRLLLGSLAAAGAGGLYYQNFNHAVLLADRKVEADLDLSAQIPSRAEQMARIRAGSREKPFDMLVIGGGATGSGCAMDAVTRGMSTVLIERDDFGSGTSSKSTKLVHGGVRYLEKAVFNFDMSQLKLVYEALHERRQFLQNAPHLTHPLPIMTPCYQWWEVPYYWAGLKAYDLVAGSTNLVMSKFLGPAESLAFLPTLSAKNPLDGRSLKGSVLYYDGQFDDSRVNVSLACTAAAAGAVVANHFECNELVKNAEGKVVGAKCRDTLGGEDFEVYAKVVVNATGPFVDGVRAQSNAAAGTTVVGSSGTHVTLPEFYGSSSVGLIIPKTKDGRVLFMLPWLGKIIAGTTDEKCAVTRTPQSTEEEVAFIIDSLSDLLGVKVRREDVLSAWTGIRPLATNPKAKSTESLVRDHIIYTDEDGMVTVTGGKWTTYRRMAEETIDMAVASGRLPKTTGPCKTGDLRLVGGTTYKSTTPAELCQQCLTINSEAPAKAPNTPLELDNDVAKRLATCYGDRALEVLKVATEAGLGRKLHPSHSILEAEVVYCMKHEMCETVDDFLERRTRLAFLDAPAALSVVPRVAAIMAAHAGWSDKKQREEVETAKNMLQTGFFCKEVKV